MQGLNNSGFNCTQSAAISLIMPTEVAFLRVIYALLGWKSSSTRRDTAKDPL